MSQSPGDLGWAWFRPDAAAQAEADEDDLARAAALIFAGPDGARVLDHLRQRTLGARLPPSAYDRELWYLEGQRALVMSLLSLIHRGRTGP